MKFGTGPLKVLDFDVEARPMAWYGGDLVTKQPTAIAWKFIGEPGKPRVAWIGASHEPDNLHDEEIEMLEAFREAWLGADCVSTHWGRQYDCPVLNGACMRLGIPGLGPKLVEDTKVDMDKASGLSKSMENLGAMFHLKNPKVPMDTTLWFEANCLTTRGIEFTIKRVVGDVEEHVELRARMLELGILGPPKLWRPTSSGRSSRYTP
jgi:hypothetical protein